MIKKIILIGSILWQLPQNIFAILMLPFLGDMKLISYEKYCWAFECSKMRGGISLGNFIFLSKNDAKRKASILHEYGHVVQSHILGWLYLIVIGIPIISNATFGFTKCYYDFWTEKWANKIAGVKTGRNQYSCYTYIDNNKDN